jgi:hypothetical protein
MEETGILENPALLSLVLPDFEPGLIRGLVQIDKAFLIAKPMRKASWTKRFVARWGSAGVPIAIVRGGQTVRSASARENDREITPGARSGIVTASFGT